MIAETKKYVFKDDVTKNLNKTKIENINLLVTIEST
jgi:hypothetical protein